MSEIPVGGRVRLTPAQERALRHAARHERGTVCPIPGVYGDAEEQLLQALYRRGLIEDPDRVPRITAAGRAAIAKAEGKP